MNKLLLLVLVVLVSATSVQGQTYTWTGATNGLWNTATNWTGGVPISGIDTILNFNNNTNVTTTQDITTSPTPMIVNQINFGSSAGGFVINGAPIEFRNNSSGTGPVLSNTSTNAATINSNLVLTNTLTVTGSGVKNIGGTVTGSGGLTITGGRVNLTGTMSYQGNTQVNNLNSILFIGAGAVHNGAGDLSITSGVVSVHGTLNHAGNTLVTNSVDGLLGIYAGGVFNSPGTITFDVNNWSYFEVFGTVAPGGLITLGSIAGGSGQNARPYLSGNGTINRNVELRQTNIITAGLTLNGNLTSSQTTGTIGTSVMGTNSVLYVNGSATFGGSFSLGANSTLNVSGPIAVNGSTMTIPATSTLGGTGTTMAIDSPNGTTAALFLGTSITRNITTTVSGNGGLTVGTNNQSAPGTINGSITATGGISIEGITQPLTITGPISLSGGGNNPIRGAVTANSLTTVNTGTNLFIGNFVSFLGPGAVQINAGGSMHLGGSSVTMNKAVTSAGAMTVFDNMLNTVTYGGPVITTTGATLQGGSGTPLRINNTLTVNGTTTVINGGPVTVTGLTAINPGGSLITQSGGTFIAQGGIAVSNNASFTANSVTTAITTVNSGGTVTGAGTINGTVLNALTILPGGNLKPGNSPGQITIGGGLDAGGILEIEISNGNTNTTTNGGFDTVRVTPPPVNPAPTDAIIRTATTVIRLLTGNADQSTFNNDTFWGTSRRWSILTTTDGDIELRDANNNLLGPIQPASVQLFSPNGQTALNPYAQYPNSSFTFEMTPMGNGAKLDLVWAPVPEPTTLLATASLLLLGAYTWQRRGKASAGVSVPV
ncbi:MAG: beta strand repeat-containing protein [Fimbriiglobus sp.]